MLVLAVLVILNVTSLRSVLSRSLGERAVESTVTESATPPRVSWSAAQAPAYGPSSGSVTEVEIIQVDVWADSAKPFEPYESRGRYRSGADTLVRLQRWENGKWLAFPVPTTTDQSGEFHCLCRAWAAGPYRLRVLDPGSA